jgi:hypothetical protein
MITSMEGGEYFVSDRVGGYKPYELQKVGVVEKLPQDAEAVARLEAESKQVVAEKRMTRKMNKEGIEASASVSAPREQRVKKPRDIGPYYSFQ